MIQRTCTQSIFLLTLGPQHMLRAAKKYHTEFLRLREHVDMILGPLCWGSHSHLILKIPNIDVDKKVGVVIRNSLIYSVSWLPYFISKSDVAHKSICLYCSTAHRSCDGNTGEFLVLAPHSAEKCWRPAKHIKNLQQGVHLLLQRASRNRATEKPYFDTEIG
jgi:hypothetical protein